MATSSSDSDSDTVSGTTVFTVNAGLPWQNSGVVVQPGNQVYISFSNGLWTANPATGNYDANGDPAFVAKIFYAYPGAAQGELIGRVGTTLFVVGDGNNVPTGLSGPLEFCINDDIYGVYGLGLTDNQGSVTIRIALS